MDRHSGDRKESFGTIVFISDLDLSEKEVYRIYCERWLLELMDDLSSAWRSAKGESVKQKDNDRCWIHTLPSVMDDLVKLDLATCINEKRKPGRPRKEKPVSDAPKRPIGRPRKNH